ncbi:STAS domain-containing protein [Streptomyces sp. NPDC060334]|uniref:STAS domain-containing protein n=1 Tax=unclassified Streptomyces TaxID=2593676 RepID=UPI00331975CF
MSPQPGPLRLTRTDADDSVRIELHGDFDYLDADALLDVVGQVLAEQKHDALGDLHLDCEGMASIDSSGLSVLLMLRRLTDAAGVRLHVDNRPLKLDRMLKITGTVIYLTGHDARNRPSSTGETT